LLEEEKNSSEFIEVKEIWATPIHDQTGSYNSLIEAAEAEHRELDVFDVTEANQTSFPQNIVVQVLSPPSSCTDDSRQNCIRTGANANVDNGNSLVTRIEYNNVKFLFTADATHKTEKWLVDNKAGLIDVDIMNAPHHGTQHASTESFVENTSPKIVVFSANVGNTHGHPSQMIRDRYEASDEEPKTFQTGLRGHVTIKTDGNDYCKIFLSKPSPPDYPAEQDCWENLESVSNLPKAPDVEVGEGKEIIFRTEKDDDSKLGEYLRGPNNEMEFKIYTYVSEEIVRDVRLVIEAEDVDQNIKSQKDPKCSDNAEIDEVWINDEKEKVGILYGNTDRPSTTVFNNIDKSQLKWMSGSANSPVPGTNTIKIKMVSDDDDCKWAVKINSGEIQAEVLPMVFVPGIGGTEIWAEDPPGTKKLIWMKDLFEHIRDKRNTSDERKDLDYLALNPEGNGPIDSTWNVYPGKIIRNAKLADRSIAFRI